ncbi:Protein/nucleic acid deglycase DJ-1 [Seminavis robusta]|uniref:Protein/nucleic acid deglycase DJ-1 n=1 Tax=Seminavis robusta TaxID=568900 RepID=A0A9N8DI53_9STRA|nr:Protein/nucleic acid deglycase DJ-1 [Seminavis robusta]|eukprot:Sro139_g065260.1 Protein/nucleic acid deglycase DJ-1 (230) ;mRNA; r:101318-102248
MVGVFLRAHSCRAIVSIALVISRPSLAFTTTATRSFTSTTSLAMSKKVLVPIGEGSEEIETTCITDTLTRFGADVTIASVMNGELVCKMSRGIKVMADATIEDAAKEEWDLVALPGGMPGATHLKVSKALTSILEKQKGAKKLYGAVCASPAVVLASQGFLDESVPSTCYPAPGFRDNLKIVSDDKVVIADNVVTSQGPGTSLLFALALGEKLYGKEKRDEIAKQMLVD